MWLILSIAITDLPFEEQELARLYPAHTALCIRDGWDFCDVNEAFGKWSFVRFTKVFEVDFLIYVVSMGTESSMNFLKAQWSERIPPGYAVEQALIDKPSEEDLCSCQFKFIKQNIELEDLTLRYQWYIGGKTPTNFVAIEGAAEEVSLHSCLPSNVEALDLLLILFLQ